MNAFTRSVAQAFTGAIKAFSTFPVSIGSALCFAVVTIIRIQLEWPQQEPYNFLFNCLHWSFALGAIFSLAAITAAQSRYNTKNAFLLANALGVIAVVATFIFLYYFGGQEPVITGARYDYVSAIAVARVIAVMLISILSFIVLASYPAEKSDFARSMFMTHKAFFISLFYGMVIMGGASGVAGAFQALLYNDMSEKVYMYIATLTGFLVYTMFVGYFPDFRKDQEDPKREIAQKQPRFIEILFVYILIPIILAMTVVLLAWAIKTILEGMGESSFIRLSGIASSYALVGLWLHIMVTHNESGWAKFYRRVYPIAALVILAFEAWALVVQLKSSGLKTAEYSFSLLLILAASAAILLLIYNAKAHLPIVAITCALAIFAVLPVAGYYSLPVRAQIDRLENILTSQNILKDGELVPAQVEPEKDVRIDITDAVEFIAYAEGVKLPVWFDQDLAQSDVFQEKLGFEKTWPDFEPSEPGGYMGTFLYLPSEPIAISDYDWAVNPQNIYGKGDGSVLIKGNRGDYKIYWLDTSKAGIPALRIKLDDAVILDRDMNEYIDKISEKYPPGQNEPREASLEDMSMKIETAELSVLIVFNNAEINVDPQNDVINYWIGLNSIYIKEKP